MIIRKNILTQIILFIATIGVLLVGTTLMQPAYAGAATARDEACESIGGCSSNAEGGINNIFKIILNVFSVVAGIIGVIMIIVAGFKFITSGGDSSKIASARNTIIYALIGLLIVAFAQVITRFVLAKATTTVVETPAASDPNRPGNATN